jgi:hypothetical protein
VSANIHQILSNPAKATRSNHEGIAHVITRMNWYCSLTEHLLKDFTVNKSLEPALQLLRKSVFKLYKTILCYQMNSVRSYNDRQVFVFLRGLANGNYWDEELEKVKNAERTLLDDWKTYDKIGAKGLSSELVKLAKKIEEQLGVIHQDLREFIDQQRKIQADSENKECLQDLRVVNPQDDMERIEDEKEKLFDDAYKWILEDDKYSAFTNWDESEPPCRLLWIKGHAGTGKTMLLMGIIRELSKQPAVLAPTLSYFFCQSQGRTNTALNKATATLRTLIWMLLIQQPRLILHFQEDYRSSRGALFTDINAWVAMSRVFKSMLKDARPVYFIVDALDECDEGLKGLIELISTSLTLSDKVRWLVSSRPEVEVLAELKNPDISRVVGLDAEGLDGPVDAYINHKLSTLKGRKGYTDIVLAEISDEVHRRAENIFLWVALVFKKLESERGWHAVKIVKEMPPGLPELYNHMMTRIERDTMDLQYCKNVLVATSLAYRPLSFSELALLAGLGPEIDLQTIVEECGSFLTTKEDLTTKKKTVYLIHKSAKDYLDVHHTSKLQKGGIVQGHADISRRSIDAISKLQKNIYALHLGSEFEDITVPNPDPLEGLQYCCVYWIQHLQKSDAKPYDYDQVYLFLQKHLLHWLEALGWMGKTSEGIRAILLLEAQISVSFLYNISSKY